MANLFFKRGLSTKLPASGSAKDGVFYLTTDTERLYVGISGTDGGDNARLVELNKSIRTVATLEDLNKLVGSNVKDGTIALGDFYYIEGNSGTENTNTYGKNILAVATAIADDGKVTWTQVNPDSDSRLTEDNDIVDVTYTDETKTVLISTEVTDTNARNSAQHNTAEGSFSITASGNLTMTVDGNNIKLDVPAGAKYDLGATANDTQGEIYLVNQQDSNDKDVIKFVGAKDSGITVKSAAAVTDADGNVTTPATVTITGTDYTIDSVAFKALGTNTGDNYTTANTGYEVAVTDKQDTAYALFDPQVQYGKDITDTNGHFVNNVLGLNVYTKSEADTYIADEIKKAKQDFDAMTYKGTIADVATLKAKTGVQIGDTYKVSKDFTAKLNDSDETAPKAGDLIIATSNAVSDTSNGETNGVIGSDNLVWELVPSGDEQAITFKAIDTTNGIVEVIDNNDDYTGIKVASGNLISVAYTALGEDDNNKNILVATVNHNTLTTKATTADAETQSAGTSTTASSLDITTVTAVDTDDYGHVKEVTTKKFTVTDTHNAIDRIDTSSSVTDNVATITETIWDKDGVDQSGSLTVTSDNIKITNVNTAAAGSTAGTTAITMNFVWGEF